MGNTIGNTYVDVVEVLGLDGEELELEIALEKTKTTIAVWLTNGK